MKMFNLCSDKKGVEKKTNMAAKKSKKSASTAKKTRKIDGETFKMASSHTTKTAAKSAAKKARKAGNRARVVEKKVFTKAGCRA
jgi:hypothetical protein